MPRVSDNGVSLMPQVTENGVSLMPKVDQLSEFLWAIADFYFDEDKYVFCISHCYVKYHFPQFYFIGNSTSFLLFHIANADLRK